MNFDDFDILKEIENQEKKAQNQEIYEKRESMGYNQVIESREAHKQGLRERLYKYYLNDTEIDELFKIITKYEEKIDKEKDNFNYEKAKIGDSEKMYDKILNLQKDMKKEFEKELAKTIKKKIEYAKKIAAQKNRK